MKVTFERTEDLDLVREIITDPRCWRRMVSDQAPTIEDFEFKADPRRQLVVAMEERRAVAVFLLLDYLYYTEVHFCFRPEAWGRSEAIAIAFVDWVWRETYFVRLVGPVPGYNRLAAQLARKAGFREFNRIPRHVLRRGKLYDLILLEAVRPIFYRREAGAPPCTKINSSNSSLSALKSQTIACSIPSRRWRALPASASSAM